MPDSILTWLLVILAVLVLAAACTTMVPVSVRDADSGKPLPGVRVVAERGAVREELGTTDAGGRLAVPEARLRGAIVHFFLNYYRNISLPAAAAVTNAVDLRMVESRPPAEVTGIELGAPAPDGRRSLRWQASKSPDTASHAVYLKSGLAPKEQLVAEGLSQPVLTLADLPTGTDHFFRIVATDRHGNRNRGSLSAVSLAPEETVLPANAALSGRISGIPAGVPVLVDALPVNLGPWGEYSVQKSRTRCDATGAFRFPALPAGHYSLFAFADANGNGAWDGHWLGGTAEPSVRLDGVLLEAGKTRTVEAALAVPEAGLPEPVFAENPGLVDLYNAVWKMARAKVTPGRTENGFVPAYMDEGFNNHIYQWDTCFIVQFGIYGGPEFPAMPSLDNFYAKQRPSGFICRVQAEETGRDYDPSAADPHLNPPLFAWAEYQYYRLSGDPSRLLRALRHNDRFFRWIKHHCRTKEGFYFTSNLGSGMDNSPREGQAHGWVDLSAQMGLFAWHMAALADAAGIGDLAANYRKEHAELGDLVNSRMWDGTAGFYFDVKRDGSLHRKKTIASFWPLIARLCPAERLPRLVKALADPADFGTPHPFPTLARSEPEYDAKGYYWRGAVWAPTTFMAVKGLEAAGETAFARRAALAHLERMLAVWRDFVPEKRKLPYKNSNIPFPDHLDGTRQVWEAYAPETDEPATRWDNSYYCRPEFVGWSGVGPVTLFIENVIGIRCDAPARRITWHLAGDFAHGVRRLAFAGGRLDLVCTGFRDGKPQIEAVSPVDLVLELHYNGTSEERAIPARR